MMKTIRYRLFLIAFTGIALIVLVMAILTGCSEKSSDDDFTIKPVYMYVVNHNSGIDTLRADDVDTVINVKSGHVYFYLNSQKVGMYVWSKNSNPVQFRIIPDPSLSELGAFTRNCYWDY